MKVCNLINVFSGHALDNNSINTTKQSQNPPDKKTSTL